MATRRSRASLAAPEEASILSAKPIGTVGHVASGDGYVRYRAHLPRQTRFPSRRIETAVSFNETSRPIYSPVVVLLRCGAQPTSGTHLHRIGNNHALCSNRIRAQRARDYPMFSVPLLLKPLVLPRCNTQGMTLHLAEIAAAVAPGAHAVLLLDQAGWHISAGLIIPADITLLPLPAKCPDLNPVENVWQFMRDNWLSNRILKSYDDILDHCCFAWNRLTDQPWRIMAIGLRQWAHG
jgi:transposase